MLELLFLLSFTLHNIEEALWLPKWSKHAKPFHPEVTNNEFHFAVLIVTILGYFITFLNFVADGKSGIIKYIYFGFVLMMSMNAIFPHLIATFLLRKYAPGTITGCALNLPIGVYIVFVKYGEKITNIKLLISFMLITLFVLSILRVLFKIGKTLLRENAGS